MQLCSRSRGCTNQKSVTAQYFAARHFRTKGREALREFQATRSKKDTPFPLTLHPQRTFSGLCNKYLATTVRLLANYYFE